MKPLLFCLFCFLFSEFKLYSQEKTTYQVGDEVEYFDGVNWLESQIIEVGQNGKYLIYINRSTTQTSWFRADDLQPLYKPDKIISTKVEVTEVVVAPLFRVADIVKYYRDTSWVLSEIIKPGPDYTYQIYTDTTKKATVFKHEKELVLVKSNYHEIIDTVQKQVNIVYNVGDIVEYFDGVSWRKSKIFLINQDGNYLFKESAPAVWYSSREIRFPKKTRTIKQPGEAYKEGDVVSVYNGKVWKDCEIIQVGTDGRIQVFYNDEKTVTKWVEMKDVK